MREGETVRSYDLPRADGGSWPGGGLGWKMTPGETAMGEYRYLPQRPA